MWEFFSESGKMSMTRLIMFIMVVCPMIVVFKQAFSGEEIQWFESLSMMASGGGIKLIQKVQEVKKANNESKSTV